MAEPSQQQFRTVVPSEQLQKRVRELARQISADYRGETIHVLAVLENAFIFTADLVRALETTVVCQFIKPRYSHPGEIVEIFFTRDPEIKGKHILLVEGMLHSGITTEFLMSDLRSRGAASVRVVTLADRQSARRVQLQPDYFGFLVDDAFLVGYGLGSPDQTYRNLPYLASPSRSA